jgi:hypothetical protein
MKRSFCRIAVLFLFAAALGACTARDPFDDCYHKCKGARTPYPEGACIELCKKAEATPTSGASEATPIASAASLVGDDADEEANETVDFDDAGSYIPE